MRRVFLLWENSDIGGSDLSKLACLIFPIYLQLCNITSGAVFNNLLLNIKITAIDVYVFLVPGPPCGHFRVN